MVLVAIAEGRSVITYALDPKTSAFQSKSLGHTLLQGAQKCKPTMCLCGEPKIVFFFFHAKPKIFIVWLLIGKSVLIPDLETKICIFDLLSHSNCHFPNNAKSNKSLNPFPAPALWAIFVTYSLLFFFFFFFGTEFMDLHVTPGAPPNQCHP